MKIVFVLIAVAAGMGSALESGSNSMLQKTIDSPLWAVALVATVSLVAALILAIVLGGPAPVAVLGRVPWWAWLGGLFGVLFLYATVQVSPKLGAGPFIATIVTASTLMSLALDNFGWMGFEIHKAGFGRIVGWLLMTAGVACIAIF